MTKEDITNNGWKGNDFYTSAGTHFFKQYDGNMYRLTYDFEKFVCHISYASYTLLPDTTLFFGELKNVADLKYVCKLLKIE